MWQPVLPFENILLTTIIALIPIIWIFLSMLKLHMPSQHAGITSLIFCIVIAALVWKMPAKHIIESIAEGLAVALWPILWVIFTAIFTYNLSLVSGSMDTISKMLSSISEDRRVQALIIAFAFGGFLEAAAGFGTAVAIPASILMALGFKPLKATIISLVANTISVAFGVVGIPVITLAQITDMPLDILTLYTALQLLPFVIILPFFLVYLTTGKIKDIAGVIGFCFSAGLSFAAGQTFIACLVGPELAAIGGSLFALAVLILWAKLFPVKKPLNFYEENKIDPSMGKPVHDLSTGKPVHFKEGLKAWSPYIFILAFVLLTRLIPAMEFLSKYPFEVTLQFYSGAGGKPVSFPLLTSPGSIILISAVLGGLLQGVSIKAMLSVAMKTLKQTANTTLTVISIVSLAKLMGYSGMSSVIASSLSLLTGRFFPLISPSVGALGTFITGSDTSSNVLFGELQKQTAIRINADAGWITAANASGATAGKMVSPQSIAIATSSTGLKGDDGKILGETIKYALIFVALLGIIVFGVQCF